MAVTVQKGKVSAEEVKEALRGRKVKVVHLTHNDLDAAGSDAIHRLKYGEVFTIWASVKNFSFLLATLSDVKGGGDLVSITDLGYQQGVERWLKKARDAGWKVEWRDHHRWEDREADIVRIAGRPPLHRYHYLCDGDCGQESSWKETGRRRRSRRLCATTTCGRTRTRGAWSSAGSSRNRACGTM